MKSIILKIALTSLLLISIASKLSNSSKNKKPDCSISSIHITPSGEPIFRYRLNKDLNLENHFTVLDDKLENVYEIQNSRMVTRDDKTHQIWYRRASSSDLDTNAFEACRKVATEFDINTQDPEKKSLISKVLVPELPKDVIEKKKESSFIQISEVNEPNYNVFQELNDLERELKAHNPYMAHRKSEREIMKSLNNEADLYMVDRQFQINEVLKQRKSK